MPDFDQLYERFVLDSTVDAALGVAHDFRERPTHYRTVPPPIVTALANFYSDTGNQPNWPSAVQRATIYNSCLGNSVLLHANDHAFGSAAAGLYNAAAAFVENQNNGSPLALLYAGQEAARTLRAYVDTVVGGSALTDATNRVTAIFNQAENVLRNDEISRAFGLPAWPAAPAEWPLGPAGGPFEYSGHGALLMETITRTRPELQEIPQTRFLILQRAAQNGRDALVLLQGAGWQGPVTVGPPLGPADLVALLGSAYAWGRALRELTPRR
jgi:hypothetical protein